MTASYASPLVLEHIGRKTLGSERKQVVKFAQLAICPDSGTVFAVATTGVVYVFDDGATFSVVKNEAHTKPRKWKTTLESAVDCNLIVSNQQVFAASKKAGYMNVFDFNGTYNLATSIYLL